MKTSSEKLVDNYLGVLNEAAYHTPYEEPFIIRRLTNIVRRLAEGHPDADKILKDATRRLEEIIPSHKND